MTHIDILEEPYHDQIFLHDLWLKIATVYKYKLHLSISAYKAGYSFYNPYTDDHARYFEPTRGTKQGIDNRFRRQPPIKQTAESKLRDIYTEHTQYFTEPLPTPSL